MKAIAICVGVLWMSFVVTMIFFYPFQHPFYEELGKARYVIEPILILQPFCGLWMLYQAIRHDERPLPYVLLAISVPFAFVWYYVERVRPRKQTLQ